MKFGFEWLAVMVVIVLSAILFATLVHYFKARRLRNLFELCMLQAAEILAEYKRQYPYCEGAVNAVTTEPGLRQARSKDITHEDFVDALDRISPAATPILSMSRNEVKLKAVDRTWNVDSYPTPKGALGRADNEPAPGSGNALSRDWSANIRKMGNIAQGFSETWRRGWIADVPQIAGVNDIDAYAKAGAYELLKQHMEVAFGSFDQVAVYDAGVNVGALGAGYLKLTASANAYSAASAYAIGKPTDLHSAPSGAVLSGALSAVHTRAMWKGVAKALRTAAKQKTDWLLIAGLNLRQAVTDLTIPTTVTVTAAATGTAAVVSNTADQVRVLLRNEADSVLGATVDVIQTDFGRIMVTETDYLGTTTTTSSGAALTGYTTTSADRVQVSFISNPSAGIIVKKGNLFKTWAKTPFTEKLGATGAGDEFDAKCLAMFGVVNPILAGHLNFS